VLFLAVLSCLVQRFWVRQEPAVCTDWFVRVFGDALPTAPDTINCLDHVAVVGARFGTSDRTHSSQRRLKPTFSELQDPALGWYCGLIECDASSNFTALHVIRMTVCRTAGLLCHVNVYCAMLMLSMSC